MKNVLKVGVILILAFSSIVVGHVIWLSSFIGNEEYPEDNFLFKEENKTALIIVAHDDDAISNAGTIAALVEYGWKVHFLTFYGNHHAEMNETRKREASQAAKLLSLGSTHFIDFSMAKSDTVKEPWMPIAQDKWDYYYKTDSLKYFIASAIELHQPSVIFTLDNIMGGYGHPEHACVSQSIIDVCQAKKATQVFSVKRIYQAVFTPTMNDNIIGHLSVFIAAKNVYKVNKLPEPSVEIDISKNAVLKTDVMLAYKSQHKNLKKFWPYYNWYPPTLYWNIFNKEYFRVVTI